MREVYCMDGVRKGRSYWWPPEVIEGREFQISTLVAGNVYEAYMRGGSTSGYAGFIYKIFCMWGTGKLVAYQDRIAYDGKLVQLPNGAYVRSSSGAIDNA